MHRIALFFVATAAGGTLTTIGCGDGGQSLPPCANGVLDPGETSLDCGGACGLCPGEACVQASSCASQSCDNEVCAVATCHDGIQNAAERGTDCGGYCEPCAVSADAVTSTQDSDTTVSQTSAPDTTETTTADTGATTNSDVTATTDPDTTTTTDTTASTGSPPRILSLRSNIATMSPKDPDQRLIVTAVVTDPDGIDDLIGGSLVAPGGIAAYGAFATAASEGSYEISLTLDEITDVSPVASSPAGGTALTFVAEFYDVGGNKVIQELSIDLKCGSADEGICDDSCYDFFGGTEYCGGCNRPIASNDECRDGQPWCGFAISPLPSSEVVSGATRSLGYTTSMLCGSTFQVRYPLAKAFRYTATTREQFSARLNYADVPGYLSLFLRKDTGTCAGEVLDCPGSGGGYNPMSNVSLELAAGETVILTFVSDEPDTNVDVPYYAVIAHDVD